MPLEYRSSGSGGDAVTCTGCPFCGDDLHDGDSLAVHLRWDCDEKGGPT